MKSKTWKFKLITLLMMLFFINANLMASSAEDHSESRESESIVLFESQSSSLTPYFNTYGLKKLSIHGSFYGSQTTMALSVLDILLRVHSSGLALHYDGDQSIQKKERAKSKLSLVKKLDHEQSNFSKVLWGFWDSGREGLEKRPIERGNIENWTRFNPDRRALIVHMNPSEYDADFIFERLSKEDFPEEFFDMDSITNQELLSYIKIEIEIAAKILEQKFTYPSEQYHQKMERVKNSYIMRAYMAQKMSVDDVVGASQSAVSSKIDLYKKAAVPLSDLVRLALLHKYGGTWLDSTIAVNRNLDEYEIELQNGTKDIAIFFNKFITPNDELSDLDPRKKMYSGETWFIATREARVPAIENWFSTAVQYWVQKQEGVDILNHPLFSDSVGKKVKLNLVADDMRNYLWPYHIWSKIVLENPSHIVDTVVAFDAFGYEVGPHSLISFYEWNHENFGKLNKGSELTYFLLWVKQHGLVKVPGGTASALGRMAPQRLMIFNYLWGKIKWPKDSFLASSISKAS